VQQKKCLTSVGVEEVLSAVCESLSEATVAAGSS
jgi:hypothetical protein